MLTKEVEERYREWLGADWCDAETKAELAGLQDEREIEDRFYCDLEFGTGGMRGQLGAGTNRMNIYLIRRLTQALADVIADHGAEAKARGVAISYDSRRFSWEFALESALVLAANGIKAYLFKELRPTPVLSFAVRAKGAIAGIMITASHNPKEYNGYKVYWEDGGQLPPEHADKIVAKMTENGSWQVDVMDKEAALQAGLLEMMGKEIDDEYVGRVREQMMNGQMSAARGSHLNIVYTPLHGTGRVLVERILAENGFTELHEVTEQAVPDPEFSTVSVPNPEDDGAWALAEKLADKIEDEEDCEVDLLLATDPDADRLGVCCRLPGGGYQRLTGNQVGVLLAYYIIKQEKEMGTLPVDAMIIKSVVSTALANKVITGLGVTVKDVPVGFKYIGEQIKLMEESGRGTFLLGFEESLGYLKGTYARDKDAVLAAALVAEAALYYKELLDKSLLEVLDVIYDKFGYFLDTQVACTLSGIDGREQIKEIMQILREDDRQEIGGLSVMRREFYDIGEKLEDGERKALDFPHVDMLGLTFADGSFVKIRPSGTEPKIRFYFCIGGEDKDEAEDNLQAIKKDFFKPISQYVKVK
jgi:phosphoglucomutase